MPGAIRLNFNEFITKPNVKAPRLSEVSRIAFNPAFDITHSLL